MAARARPPPGSHPGPAPSASPPPNASLLQRQLQDLAGLPGARWRFYRLRVDRPARDAESSGVRGALQQLPVKPVLGSETGLLRTAAPPARQTPQRPRTHGGWSCGKFPPLHPAPRFWEGTRNKDGPRRGGSFREAPSAGLPPPTPRGLGYGQGLSETRSAPLLFRGAVMGKDAGKGTGHCWGEGWSQGFGRWPVSDPKSPYPPPRASVSSYAKRGC